MQLITTSPRDVLGSETITVDNTAGGVGLSATKYNPVGLGGMNHKAKEAFITVEDQSIRWNIDPGVTVTATTNGHKANDGDAVTVYGQALENFRAIRTGGVSATIRVTYFG